MTTTPVAVPRARVLSVHVDRHGHRSVRVACPFGCRFRTHTHGWPPGEPQPGLRVAHCVTGPQPAAYDVVVPEELTR